MVLGESSALRRHIVAVALLGGLLAGGLPVCAAAPQPRAQALDVTIAQAIPPGELDRAIDTVMSQREYHWRLAREKSTPDEMKKGGFAAFMDGLIGTLKTWGQTLKRWAKAAAEWVLDALEWLKEKLFGRSRSARAPSGGGAGGMLSVWLLAFVLVAAAASTIAVFAVRVWRRRRRPTVVTSVGVTLVPDIADENVVACELPEDEWLRLARELMSQGELRLALRALYLGSLAHLARQEFIRLEKFKSNRDYERELRRRARALPELQEAFSQNVTMFDRAWYGLHDVTDDVLTRFQANLERIQSC